jgi:protein TonB
MFRETLLESSASGRTRKRWPMLVAFALEVLAGLALIILPLLSTGVIPVSAHTSCAFVPLGRANATRPPDGNHRGGGVTLHLVALAQRGPCFSCEHVDIPENGGDDPGPPNIGDPHGPPLLDAPASHVALEQRKPPERIRVSEINEGQLIHKVDPVYPRIALITGTRGDVRIHAIIAKDGTIQSLTVVSGPPLLIAAARDAVSQWRYRPYLLNGQPVEVETFITVSFKGIRD